MLYMQGPQDGISALKGDQPRILTGRSDAEAEAPILWLHNVKS